MKTLGAIPPNEKSILKRSGKYKTGGGGKMSKMAMHNDPKVRQEKYNGSKVFGTEGNISDDTGTSIFDPVLCELIYRWFSPVNGVIIDPFAGGSVRGIVASKLQRQYIGVELRLEQVEANRHQAEKICKEPQPLWHCGDSMDIEKSCKGVEADLLFTCPPYADLEVYSDLPNDISNMKYPEFLKAYREIVKRSCTLLKSDSFAAIVVGEVRDKKGHYLNFVGDTITAFIDAGLKYYNEAILITCVGSLPIRVGRQFNAGRKFGKTHQNVLIFVKGDSKKATSNLGECEFGEITEDESTETETAD